MATTVELKAGLARLVLLPELGGGIGHLDLDGRPILRPWSEDENNPFSLACNTLVPFSNRISGGAFTWDGQRFDIAPNLPGERFPIHGDAFQKAWTLDARCQDSAKLTLDEGSIGPFRYTATQEFRLSAQSLGVDLSVTNTGGQTLPFGCGFHPWFPRDDHTKLGFAAEGVWMEDTNYLPTQWLALADAPDWQFSQARVLPDHWINNAYTRWSGSADIAQGDAFVSTRIAASSILDHAIVHSTGKGCRFVCFEPVSHAVDAINQAGHPGLTVLAPGETMDAHMTLDWSAC